jgi:hypothetical protein
MNSEFAANPPVSDSTMAPPSDGGPLPKEVTLETLATFKESSGHPITSRPKAAALRWVVLSLVWLLASIYVGAHIGKGWVPADEGTLSQSALRVLHGQLPHRDFGEIYTGGLSMLHAAAFRLFGLNLLSLRICVFVFFLAWIPAIYYIALRFTSAVGAGLVTLLAVSWSFPNYPAAMPSWYNLFFATFGAASLLRYLEVRSRRWLFIAGVCGGLSILVKVIGAYYVAGALLSLVFFEQSSHEESGARERAVAYRAFSISALLLFLATLIYFFRLRLGDGELYELVLPAFVLAGMLFINERKVSAGSSRRFRSLLALVVPFLAGILVPIAVFLVPYARSHSIDAFVSGMTGSAIAHAAGLGLIRPFGLDKSIYGLILVSMMAAAMFSLRLQSAVIRGALPLGFLLILLNPTQSMRSGVWYSMATFTPLVVLAGAIALILRKSKFAERIQRERVMVLIALAALCSLVQYPFAAPIYLLYSLPLTLLATLGIVMGAKKQAGTSVLPALTAFYVLFGVTLLVPDYIYELTHKVGPMSELRLPRAGGLRVEFADDMQKLIETLQQHSPNGLLYAGNQCPELYFLSGLNNVTRNDDGAPADEAMKAIQMEQLNVVVINEMPFFRSGVVSSEIKAEVARRFPHSAQFGIFHVFWKQ